MNRHEIRWRVYRATFDTNVLFRTLIQQGNLANHLLSLWREGRFVLVLSPTIVEEVQAVASRPRLMQKYRYTLQEVDALIHLLTQRAIIADVPCSFALCRDVKDDKFIDCAILERAQFLVSYDNDLLDDSRLKRALFEFGVEVVEPLLFLENIRNAEIVVEVSNIANSPPVR